ncbi:MAG: response regulator transcription factor [Actinomycetota bacterium]|nr:response regulator transcription factor [Actinomycetota bacterium]
MADYEAYWDQDLAPSRRSIRVVAVDDHPTFVQGLKALLQNLTHDIEIVGVARTPDEGLEQVERHLPDIVLLDVRMPRSEGCELAGKICQLFPDVKVVMLTVSEDPSDVHSSLEAGVRGYLSKLAEPEELIAALRSVNAGEIVLAPFAATVSFGQPRQVMHLADAEIHLLRLASEGLDRAQIAQELVISESTLKRMFGEVQRKLGANSRIQAVALAAKKGLI